MSQPADVVRGKFSVGSVGVAGDAEVNGLGSQPEGSCEEGY